MMIFSSIGGRLVLNLAVAISVVATLLYVKTSISSESLRDMQVKSLKEHSEIAISLLDELNVSVEAGDLTLEAAQARAKNYFNSINYRGSEYFFVFDDDLNLLASGNGSSAIGGSVADVTDDNGVVVYEELLRSSANNGTEVSYNWSRPGFEGTWNKVSVAIPFEPWGWHVGTGVYTAYSDVYLNRNKRMGRLIAGCGVIALLLAATVITRSITRPIKRLEARMVQLQEGDDTSSVPHQQAGGEIGSMACAIGSFCESHREARQREATEQAAREAALAAQSDVVEKLGDGLKALSEGNFSNRLNERFEGEFDALRVDFNETISNLSALVASISDAGGELDRTSRSLRESNDAVANQLQQNVARLEEAAASMDEINNSALSTAKASEMVRDLSGSAEARAVTSQSAMEATREAMSAIEESSGRIAGIIDLIGDIAFRTNLLALNAGVEAARAGDAGRGFAVVASEVRSLAHQSSEAVTEISSLIQESTQQVEAGVQSLAETSRSLDVMSEAVGDVGSHMSEIADAIAQQTSNISSVSSTIIALDDASQRSAAQFMNVQTVSEEMSEMSQAMSLSVSRFTIMDAEDAKTSAENTPRAA